MAYQQQHQSHNSKIALISETQKSKESQYEPEAEYLNYSRQLALNRSLEQQGRSGLDENQLRKTDSLRKIQDEFSRSQSLNENYI